MVPWHESRLRVRFEETDMMGVVYYSKFFVYMEVGRINLLRDLGWVYAEWTRRGLRIPVVRAHLDYKSSARFDDELLVKTKLVSIGARSIRFDTEVSKLPEKRLLCTGYTVHALVDGSGKAVPFPDDVRERLTEH
jgi:acyl-CoA thioester hydrolase